MKAIKILTICLPFIIILSGCAIRTDSSFPVSTSSINIEFVTEKEMQKWRNPLLSLISDFKTTGTFDSHIFDGYALALFDVNVDGVPELLECEAGGSAGNVTFYAYDLFTGDLFAEFNGGIFSGDHNGSWCIYYDVEDNSYVPIGNYITRCGGFEEYSRTISTLAMSNEGKYTEHNLFPNVSNMDILSCSYDEFVSRYMRISNTEILLIPWVDASTVDEMANTLLSTTQKIIKQD